MFKSRPKQLVLIAVSSLLGCLAALFLAETSLRLLGVTSKLVYSPNPYYGWGHTAGDKFFWTTESRELEIQINALGLRDSDHSYEKPEGTSRILVLGDSFPEALQVRLEDGFSKVLEKALNVGAPKQIEVINAGVSGFGTDNALLFFTHEGFKYSPDIVLLTFYVGNDVRNNWYPLDELDSGGPRKPFYAIGPEGLTLHRYPFVRDTAWTASVKAFLGRHLRLYAFSRDIWNRFDPRLFQAAGNDDTNENDVEIPLDLPLFQREPPKDWDDAWQVTRAILRELRSEVKRHGAQLFVVTVPTAFQIHPEIWDERLSANDSLRRIDWSLDNPNEYLSEVCNEEQIPNLDLLPLMRSEARNARSLLYFFNDNHWNEAGHRFAAMCVAEALSPLIEESHGN